ncbi:hypothetical protein [Streptomyces sp. NPDC001657]|uniref:hypothetical protein n=1 Tax=Streptomyces sp. NPDC001657 TaxID=3154522 RepID=UPI003326A769
MGFESDHGCDLLSVHGVQDADDHDLGHGHGGVLAQNPSISRGYTLCPPRMVVSFLRSTV